MKICRLNKVSFGKIIAFFDVETSEGIVINGFKLIDMGDGNTFVGCPSKKDDSADKYNDIVIMSKDMKDKLSKQAILSYNAEGSNESH